MVKNPFGGRIECNDISTQIRHEYIYSKEMYSLERSHLVEFLVHSLEHPPLDIPFRAHNDGAEFVHIMTGDDDFVWHTLALGHRRLLRPSSFLDLRESGNSRTLPTPSRSPWNPPDPARRLRPTSPAEPPVSLFCLSRFPSSCGAVSTDRDGRDDTLARALRAARLSRGALAPHASARSLDRATPR